MKPSRSRKQSNSAPRLRIHELSIPSTYVPFRNAHLLSIAVSWAEVIQARKIFIGAVEEDSSGYPDCREIFYQAFNRVIETGTKPETRIEIVTPLIHMNKSAIVKRGVQLGRPSISPGAVIKTAKRHAADAKVAPCG